MDVHSTTYILQFKFFFSLSPNVKHYYTSFTSSKKGNGHSLLNITIFSSSPPHHLQLIKFTKYFNETIHLVNRSFNGI